MKSKHLLSLVVVAAVLVGLAWWSSNRGKPAPGAVRIGDKVLPGLLDKVNDVATLRIESPSGTTVVARVDGIWRVPGKHGYRASFSKVSDALRKLADLKITQVMRIAPVQLADLGLLPASASNTEQRATVLELKAVNGATLSSLRLGKEHNRPAPAGASPEMGYPDGRFVALDDTKVYLVGETLTDLTVSEFEWLDDDFLNVSAAEIASIDVTGGTNGAVHLERPAAGGELTLKNVPPGKEMDSSAVARLSGALTYLRFEDVADPALGAAVTGLDKPVVYKATTSKGVAYTLKLGSTPAGDTRRYASVAVSFTAPPAAPLSATDTNAAAMAQAKAEEDRKTASDAQTMNDKFSPWVYLLGESQAGSMMLPVSELLKDKPAVTNAAPTVATSPAEAK